MRGGLSYIGIIFFLAGLNLYSGKAFSQSIRIISATSQGWSGGVCCRTGIDYRIQLMVSGRIHELKLDTLWMEGFCSDISNYLNYKKVKSDTSVIIYGGVSWDEGMPNANTCFDHTKKGVILSYSVAGKKKTLDITPYIKQLEYQAYP